MRVGFAFPKALEGSFQVRLLETEHTRGSIWSVLVITAGRADFDILAVIQNNLQYLAASNLEAATFQVTYQMKILTTAGFSVLLLRKSLSSSKWVALLFLAIGVGVVQIGGGGDKLSASAEKIMSPTTGFLAVFAACFTSGLAGVYFEVVLKNSQGDLWVRNLQLSLFSLIPAIIPIAVDLIQGRNILDIFHGFGAWAWSTILIQVLGGLLTAMVIKYADNILKCFATSLSIILSCLASVTWFNFPLTPMFVLGSSIVLAATWIYNQSDSPKPKPELAPAPGSPAGSIIPLSRVASTSSVFSMSSSTASAIYLDSPREKGQHLSAEYIPVSQRDMV
jgi:UDP-sugar transporter A1/2/3